MDHRILADDQLMRLRPDPAWSIQGLNSFIGGIMAVCIVLAVALIVLGIITMMPGLITNNVMERAFSWKRLLAALMIPLVVGVGTSGMAWGMNAYGSAGMPVNGTYQSADGRTRTSDGKVLGQYGSDGKTRGTAHSDDLGQLVQALGTSIAQRIADTVTGALNGVKNGFDKFKDTVGGVFGKITDTMAQWAGQVGKAWPFKGSSGS